MKMYRQGDVLFTRIEKLPGGRRKRRPDGHILEGEATGHVHRVETLEAAEVLEIEAGLYMRVSAEGGVAIVHEEHSPLLLPPGDYEVTRQREYSPEQIRSVAD